jgi:hypothetical protein
MSETIKTRLLKCPHCDAWIKVEVKQIRINLALQEEVIQEDGDIYTRGKRLS